MPNLHTIFCTLIWHCVCPVSLCHFIFMNTFISWRVVVYRKAHCRINVDCFYAVIAIQIFNYAYISLRPQLLFYAARLEVWVKIINEGSKCTYMCNFKIHCSCTYFSNANKLGHWKFGYTCILSYYVFCIVFDIY